MLPTLVIETLAQVAASPQLQLPVDLGAVFTWILKGLAAVVGGALLWALKSAVGVFQSFKAEMTARLDDIDGSISTVQADVTSVKHELFGVSGSNGMRSDVRRSKSLLVKHDRLLVELATHAGIKPDLETEDD